MSRALALWCAVAAAVGCKSAAPAREQVVQPVAADAPAPKRVLWPGVHGRSGVNGDPTLIRADVEAFCSWRGRDCEIAHTYTDRESWQSMCRGSGWTFDNFAGFPGDLVISQGLVPERSGDPAQHLADCAAGKHYADFFAFGELMVQKNRAGSIVRLGWEFNGDFMPWAARDPEQWKACYRSAASALRAANPRVILDWTVNAHGTPPEICAGSSTHCYPGDDVVDIIGIDNYDIAPSATSREDFLRIAREPEGLSWLFDFAQQRGKRFSVGEWGIAPGSKYNTSGENPEFIRWMHEWFSEHAAGLAYEAYFNDSAPDGVRSNLMRPIGATVPRLNTAAGTLYRTLWSAR